jgi:hypothetical protein
MSSVYFHTPSGKVRLSGAERGWLRCLCTEMSSEFILSRIFNYFPEKRLKLERLAEILDDSEWLKKRMYDYLSNGYNEMFLQNDIRLFLSTGKCGLKFPELHFDLFSLLLNTAYLLGSNSVKLAARIHGQCELHCWIAEQNKEWIAGIIEQSLYWGIYRQDMGWDDVISLLRKNATEPVVLSFSVCDSFPNAKVADFPLPDDEYGDLDPSPWENLDGETQWSLAFAELKKKEGCLELSPDGWNDFYFTDKKCNAIELDRLLSL